MTKRNAYRIQTTLSGHDRNTLHVRKSPQFIGLNNARMYLASNREYVIEPSPDVLVAIHVDKTDELSYTRAFKSHNTINVFHTHHLIVKETD